MHHKTLHVQITNAYLQAQTLADTLHRLREQTAQVASEHGDTLADTLVRWARTDVEMACQSLKIIKDTCVPEDT
jgi:hypothetical protein